MKLFEAINEVRKMRNLIIEVRLADNNNVRVEYDRLGCIYDDPSDWDETTFEGFSIANSWYIDAVNNLKNVCKEYGLSIDMPYNDSIYIYKNLAESCISIRTHETKDSTYNHWRDIWDIIVGKDSDLYEIDEKKILEFL